MAHRLLDFERTTRARKYRCTDGLRIVNMNLDQPVNIHLEFHAIRRVRRSARVIAAERLLNQQRSEQIRLDEEEIQRRNEDEKQRRHRDEINRQAQKLIEVRLAEEARLNEVEINRRVEEMVQRHSLAELQQIENERRVKQQAEVENERRVKQQAEVENERRVEQQAEVERQRIENAAQAERNKPTMVDAGQQLNYWNGFVFRFDNDDEHDVEINGHYAADPDEDFGPAQRRRGPRFVGVKEENGRFSHSYILPQLQQHMPVHEINSTSIGLQSTLTNGVMPTRRLLDISTIEESHKENVQEGIQPNCSLVSSDEFTSGEVDNITDESSTPGNLGGEKTTEALNNITF